MYAVALYKDPAATLDELREAVTTLEDTARIARRVLGGAHPVTKGVEGDLRNASVVLTATQINALRDAVEADTLPQEARDWYFSADGTNGGQQGPFAASELQRRYAAGELSDGAVAWNPRMTQWAQVSELPELQGAHPRNTVGRRPYRVEPMQPAQVDLRAAG